MDLSAAAMIGAGLTAIAMGGAGIGVGYVFGNFLQAAARNPAGIGQYQAFVWVGAALTEALGLFGLVLAFLILGNAG